MFKGFLSMKKFDKVTMLKCIIDLYFKIDKQEKGLILNMTSSIKLYIYFHFILCDKPFSLLIKKMLDTYEYKKNFNKRVFFFP